MMANEELESSSIELLFMPISTLICADFFWVILYFAIHLTTMQLI